MKLTVPELSLVVLIGASGSGKSTFAKKHFKGVEVISSDYCRALVSDDECDQSATTDAFEVLHFIAGKRLARGKLTVVDATNVQPESRRPLVALARQYHALPVAIIFDFPENVCLERNKSRPDRNFGPHVVRQQTQQMRRSMRGLQKEGFRHVFKLSSPEEADTAVIERTPLYNNRKFEHGPFDTIGDVHGCITELTDLLDKLGYEVVECPAGGHVEYVVTPPQGRKAVFLGDLVDRGPDSAAVLRLVMYMVRHCEALCLPGNHDMKLLKYLRGRQVQLTHGLASTVEQLEKETPEFRQEVEEFLDGLVSHYLLADGKLVVAHAGMKESMQGRGSGRVRDFALYGATTGETDEFGLPVRLKWAADYEGKALVVYGHTPVAEPEWLNRTVNIDTGCVFGGKLTAYRYPENETVSVPAKRVYYEPAKPFLNEDQELTAQQRHDELLDISRVLGKRIISTRLRNNITIREENAIPALEVMARFAADPKWLIYLPPTMSPSETTVRPGLLEYPSEAFAYFRSEGVPKVICEEKHMGSRAVIVVSRDEEVSRKRFGVIDDGQGICYTRTGRRFFENKELEAALLARISASLDKAEFWKEFDTDWVCLDCELMPWSAKAMELVRTQYAAVGAAATAGLSQSVSALELTAGREIDLEGHLEDYRGRREMVEEYIEAYRRYCWPVNSIDDYRLAPFHILATEGKVHTDKDHVWHMESIKSVCAHDPLLLATPYRVVDVTSPESEAEGAEWWEELTGRGGEGMVVKPLQFAAHGHRGFVQPALKCRGENYLRIIYGPEYTKPENLERLRSRGLGAKRSLAIREFALGIEALERFVRKEPLSAVHECVFGVLALETEPVDARL